MKITNENVDKDSVEGEHVQVESYETTHMRFSEVRDAILNGKTGFKWDVIETHEIAVKIPEKRDLRLLTEQMAYWKLRPIQVL